MKKNKQMRIVIKIGSNMVITGGPLLIRDLMIQVSKLISDHNAQVIWVSSGAIASAKEKIKFHKPKDKITLFEKQALSAIGQPLVMDLYNLALQSQGLKGAQVLLTYDDLESPDRNKNFINTIDTLLDWGVVPILNENDAVSTDEIQFGDNDMLSAKVAKNIKADKLIILTDVEGLYDRDPTTSKSAKKLDSVKKVTDEILKLAGHKSSSKIGKGGMYSKVTAAKTAGLAKIPTHLARADIPKVLLKIINGEGIGTKFYD